MTDLTFAGYIRAQALVLLQLLLQAPDPLVLVHTMLHEGIYAFALLSNLLLESRGMSLAVVKLLAALVAGASKLLNRVGLNSQLLSELGNEEVLGSEPVDVPLLEMEGPLQLPDRPLLVLEHSIQLVVA